MVPDDRLRTHPKERLASPMQQVDLAAAASQLRAEAHGSVSGHRQLALVRHGPITMILFAFDQDGRLKEHQTDGEVIIQVLKGQLAVNVAGETCVLHAGSFVALAPAQRHSVHALEASDMLLTIARAAVGAPAAS